MAFDVLQLLRAADPAAAMAEPDADERERLLRAILATPLDPRAARRWPRLRGRTLAVLVAGAVLLGGGAVYAGGYVANAPSQGKLVWKFTAGAAVRWSPAVSDGVVYVGSDDGHLYAVDAQSGQERWEFQAGHLTLSRPTVADGVVYVGAGDLDLQDLHLYAYALDAQGGQERWRFKMAGRFRVSSPAISDGVAYVADDRYLYALDVQSGVERWRFQADGRPQEQRGAYEDSDLFSPAVSDGVVYVGSNDTYLYAVDAQSGQAKWKFQAGGGFYGGFWSSAAISGGVVYISNDDGYLHALDAQSGQERWKFKTGDTLGSPPAISGGVAYVANYEDYDDHDGWDGYLHALDIQSGREKWTFRADEALADPDGTPHSGVGMGDPPAISGGVVYFGSNDGYLHGLDAQSGQEKWQFETGDPEACHYSLAVSGGLVYFGDDGHVYAMK